MAALLQRIDEALAGIPDGEWLVLHSIDGWCVTCDGDYDREILRCYVDDKALADGIAASPALLRECAALLRGLDDGAVGKLRQKSLEALRLLHEQHNRERMSVAGNAAYAAADYIAALEADNVRLREALAAAEAELRQYREPM